jgi:hypothetical protein
VSDIGRLTEDGWNCWLVCRPLPDYWAVIEWIRVPFGDPTWRIPEGTVSRLADLLKPENDTWNVAGVYWRPVA